MTLAEAQVVLRPIAFEVVRLEERYQEVLESLPRSEHESAMLEGRMPWDLPTELRTTVESRLGERSALPSNPWSAPRR